MTRKMAAHNLSTTEVKAGGSEAILTLPLQVHKEEFKAGLGLYKTTDQWMINGVAPATQRYYLGPRHAFYLVIFNMSSFNFHAFFLKSGLSTKVPTIVMVLQTAT